MEKTKPYRFSGDYSHQGRFRAVLCALLFALAVITTVCVQASLEWVGEPFNGFLMGENRIVAPIDLPSWTGRRANIPYWWQLVSIGGLPVETTRQALDMAGAAGEGTTLLYGFSDGESTVEIPIRVMTFKVADWVGLFANYLINGLALLAIGFFVAFLRPELKSARALLFLSLSWGVSLVIGLADFASFHFRTLLAVAEGFVPATLFYLALCFPNERPLARHRGLLRLVVASSAVLAAMNVLLYQTAPHVWTLAYRGGVIWVAAVILLSLRTAWKERRDSAPIEREKIKIVSLGILTAFALPFLLLGASQIVGAELPLNIVTAGWWIFPATLAYAIVQRDLFEIDVFLRRVATYVALSTAVFALYAAVLALFSHGFYNLGITTSPWFTLLFSLAVLIVFHPLRDWLQTAVDRLFFRTHFHYAETTREVSQALNQTLTAEEIADYVGDVVERTMAPTHSGLYRTTATGLVAIGDGESSSATVQLDRATLTALSQGRILDAGQLGEEALSSLPRTALLVPLSFEDRLEGALLLGPKNSGATFGPRDVELLRTLANQTAMALRNAASYNRVAELLASLESRVEERTRELQETQAELRDSNEKLRELDRVKTQFFADASHELRTPLTLVLGPLEELSRHCGDSSDVPAGWQRLVDLARSNAATLLVLTDTLLDISRIDSGQARPMQRIEALGPLLEATTEPFRWLAEQRGVSLSTSCAPNLEAWCDRAMLSKILGNLLANALKFTADGRVEVRAQLGGDAALIEVSDTGPGIPEDELPFIFDRYRQASTASRSSFAGSGIGLALVRELLELQGGSVTVASTVGRGTAFHLRLPLRPIDRVGESPTRSSDNDPVDLQATGSLAAMAASSTRGTHLASPAGAAEPAATETVLVVEDNPEMLDFIKQVLSVPYTVATAVDANTAIARLRRGGVDLIVSDVMMPGPDGIALCVKLKQDPDLRHIPLVLLTARASLDSKLTGLAAGADDYITKPFHPEELKARIGSLIRMRDMERQLRRSHEQLSGAYDDLRNAQAQLVHAEKMAALGTLVAGVAHEINNPVSFVHSSIDLIAASIRELKEILERHFDRDGGVGAIESLRAEVGDGERFSTLLENAAICQDGARRAARIVQDLRTFSRPSRNGREPTDLHDALEQSLRLLQGELKGRITIQRDYADLPEVQCDAGQISQVFLNLLANAVQAIPDKGVVTVRTASLGDRVSVQFSDSGPGMSAEIASKIFDPFFTTKEVGKGTGLGLSIVRSLINSHGGDVRVESTLGEGSTFTVTLPTNGATHDKLDIPA